MKYRLYDKISLMISLKCLFVRLSREDNLNYVMSFIGSERRVFTKYLTLMK